MMKQRPNRDLYEKIAAATQKLAGKRAEVGTYEFKREIEKAALYARINEARNIHELKDVLRFLVGKEYA